MSEWFYEKNGQRIGPIMKEQLIGLLGAGDISHQTLVWHQSQPQWLPLHATPLAADIPPSSTPPALPAIAISNTLIWILAFAPIIGIFCEGFVAGAVYHDTDQAANAVAEGSFFYISLIINIALSYWDERTLRKAGVNTQQFGKMVWLVPVYLWKRAKALQQKPTYFWCWLVTFSLIMLSSCSA
ncbi:MULTISPECIES: DUF4339 domain-containing protein [Aeromonas]|uniref:DUF4339 domain-containing protein n=1 Tax=Aeromonas TaxID=642 RepID=UPI0004D6EB36|nr:MULTISPECIES: DUF4339 domain-containing protein [Aeromonas]KEP89687.1 membrane protein [Aeromonas caviae]MBF8450972.1 DUF4339 domain-containing protein [Aeromonas dhakensis]MDX7816496.1 DUF4339 domain-containing protein [Aeromonas caviae]